MPYVELVSTSILLQTSQCSGLGFRDEPIRRIPLFGHIKQTSDLDSLDHPCANIVRPDSGQIDNKMNAINVCTAFPLRSRDLGEAMLPNLAEIVCKDLNGRLAQLVHQFPSFFDLRALSHIGRKVFFVDEKELEPAQNTFFEGCRVAPGGILIVRRRVEDARRCLGSISMIVSSCRPICDGLDRLSQFARDFPGDARVPVNRKL